MTEPSTIPTETNWPMLLSFIGIAVFGFYVVMATKIATAKFPKEVFDHRGRHLSIIFWPIFWPLLGLSIGIAWGTAYLMWLCRLLPDDYFE